jgi:hypothetical protein
MKAKLKRIDVPKYSRNGDVCFRRIYFELEDGNWAMTDLIPSFRNYKWWEPIIKSGVGTVIGGVFLKDGYRDKINADSQVFIVQEPLVKDNTRQIEFQKIPQTSRFAPDVYTISSFTIPDRQYEIIDTYGFLQCSCPDFRFMRRKCKHIKEVEKKKVEARQKQMAAMPKLF